MVGGSPTQEEKNEFVRNKHRSHIIGFVFFTARFNEVFGMG